MSDHSTTYSSSTGIQNHKERNAVIARVENVGEFQGTFPVSHEAAKERAVKEW